MLTPEEWEALSDEEKQLRADEKPDPEAKPGDQTTEDLKKSVEELTKELDSLRNEKQGIFHDLKQERETRKQLQEAIAELQNRGKGGDVDIESLADDEYLTAGQVKQLVKNLQNQNTKSKQDDLKRISEGNYVADEERMHEVTKTISDEYPVSYKDAMDEFKKMVVKRPSLWTVVHEEAIKPNGRPAEVAYGIALTSKNILSKIRASDRERFLRKLEEEGEIKPKKLPTGGSGADINPANFSEEDLLNMSDAQLDGLLQKM